MTWRSVWVLFLPALQGCCGATAPSAQPSFGFLWAKPKPSSLGDAQRILKPIAARYSTCRSYRDRGLVSSTQWTPDGRFTKVSRFDTIFVRNIGLRFRFFDEVGVLGKVIWLRGQQATTWSRGKVGSEEPVEEALVSARGVTDLTSQVVPGLLLAISFSASEQLLTEDPSVVGMASISCGKCSVLSFGSATRSPQRLVTIDEDGRAIRRFQTIHVAQDAHDEAGSLGSVASDHLITYEPEFDLADEAALVRELAVQPW